MAVGMVSTKPILTDASPVTVSCIRLIGGTTGVLLFTVVSGRIYRSIQIFKGYLPWKAMILGAFIGSYLALFAWIVGFKYTTVSIASILNQTSVFFTLLLAAIFLKERLSSLKIAGAVLGFLGRNADHFKCLKKNHSLTVHTVEQRPFTLAASSLGIAPPATSNCIRTLHRQPGSSFSMTRGACF